MPHSQDQFATCPKLGQLIDFADGALPSETADSVRQHLESCQPCSTEVKKRSATSAEASSRKTSEQSTASQRNDARRDDRESGPQRDGATAAWTPDKDSVRNSKRAADKIPEKIGRYFVLRSVGPPGSFGQVYKAKDPDTNRIVAIKVPRYPNALSEDAVAEFLREARAAGELQHEGVVQVYDWGRSDDSGCYIVMQFIDGPSLSKVLRAGRLNIRRAVELAAQVADALHHAHTHHMFHRDVKPANILLPDEDHAMLADFGLVLHRADRPDRRGEVSGTFQYMAPEQFRGDTDNQDGRTDLWSLGVVLYEMLCGQRPFDGASRDELHGPVLLHHPQPPEQLNDAVPASLSRICMQCLSKDIADRPASGRELAESLRRELKTLRSPGAPIVRRQFVWAGAGAMVAGIVGSRATRRIESDEMGRARPGKTWPIEAGAAVGEPRRFILPPAELLWPAPALIRDPDTAPSFTWGKGFNDLTLHDKQRTCFVALNETRASDCRFTLSMATTAEAPWTGRAGMFWGLRRYFDERGEAYVECSTVSLHCTDDTDDSFRLSGYKIYIVKIDTNNPQFQTELCWSSDRKIRAPKPSVPVKLDLTFTAGSLTRIGYQGTGFPIPKGTFTSPMGGFGVLSWDNQTTKFFTDDARFTLLKSKVPTQ